jgi:ribosomal protein S18 acetylase RimI-like enzyme
MGTVQLTRVGMQALPALTSREKVYIMKRLMLIARVPRQIRQGDLTLRPLRIWDGPFLARMVRQDDILWSCGARGCPEIPWFTLYRRLRTLFFLSYCIEYSSEKVGLAGFYHLRADKSAEMSLVIFKDSFRRKGLGTKVFRLLSGALGNCPFLERVLVSVRTENSAAQAFWTKLGFEEVRRGKDTLELELSLGRSGPAAARNRLLQSNA